MSDIPCPVCRSENITLPSDNYCPMCEYERTAPTWYKHDKSHDIPIDKNIPTWKTRAAEYSENGLPYLPIQHHMQQEIDDLRAALKLLSAKL